MGGRMAKAACAKKYRKQSCQAVLEQHIESGPWRKATVQARFYFALARRRDQDNAMAMLKAAYDGLTDSGLIIDDDYDHLQRVSPEFLVDKVNPRVELVIQRLA